VPNKALGGGSGEVRAERPQPGIQGIQVKRSLEELSGPGEPIVAGKYRLVRLIGSGGMGTVFEAVHVQIGRSLALKFLRQDRDPSPRSLRRFSREAELLGRLEHENIVGLHDIGVDPERGPYLVLEYVRGPTLRSELERHGRRSIARTAAIVRQIGRGLSHAHGLGIVHRDLKPENVILAEHANGGLLVKLLDFGVASLREGGGERVTLSDAAVGTAEYMAPEQARGERTLGAPTDVYALGVLVYEMLSGVRPYAGSSYNETLFNVLQRNHKPLAELRPELPERLLSAVERALSKDARARFESVEGLVDEVCAADERAARPSADSPTTLDESIAIVPKKQPRARRGFWVFSGLSLGTALGYTLGTDRGEPSPLDVHTSLRPALATTTPAALPAPPLASAVSAAIAVPKPPSQAASVRTDPPKPPAAGARPARVAPGRAEPLMPRATPANGGTDAPSALHARGYILDNPYGNASQASLEPRDD
jgi:serine/threonine-protein kinase